MLDVYCVFYFNKIKHIYLGDLSLGVQFVIISSLPPPKHEQVD